MRIINESLLAEFRTVGKCEACGRKVYPLDPDHYRCKGIGGGSRLDIRINLAALCRLCHSHLQEGAEGRRKVLEIIARRERCRPVDIEAVIDLLLRLPKGTDESTACAHGFELGFDGYYLFCKTWKEIGSREERPKRPRTGLGAKRARKEKAKAD
jgi:hypothetical protein